MKLSPSFFVLALVFNLTLTSCSWLKEHWGQGSIPLPQEELASLFEYRDLVLADARFLKSKIKDQAEVAHIRTVYNHVYASFNSAIGVIQQSLLSGNEPEDYRATLKNQVKDVKQYTEELSAYTETKAAAVGAQRTAVAIVVPVIVQSIVSLWKEGAAANALQRQQAATSLEQQKMKDFDQLK